MWENDFPIQFTVPEETSPVVVNGTHVLGACLSLHCVSTTAFNIMVHAMGSKISQRFGQV